MNLDKGEHRGGEYNDLGGGGRGEKSAISKYFKVFSSILQVWVLCNKKKKIDIFKPSGCRLIRKVKLNLPSKLADTK